MSFEVLVGCKFPTRCLFCVLLSTKLNPTLKYRELEGLPYVCFILLVVKTSEEGVSLFGRRVISRLVYSPGLFANEDKHLAPICERAQART